MTDRDATRFRRLFDDRPAVEATIQSFKFKSGSDRLTVRFTGPTSGTVVFGELPDGPPPVDPAVAYPPNCDLRSLPVAIPGTLTQPGVPAECAEGFTFTIKDAIQESDRLRFSINIADFWATWCEGQTLITFTGVLADGTPDGTPLYSCAGVAPDSGTCRVTRALPDGGPSLVLPDAADPHLPQTLVDCEVEATCGLCSCTPTGCSEANAATPLAFDLHVAGKEASGATDLGTVYLEAQ